MNERIKKIRKELNLTQIDFGARLGVTGAAISRIESGENQITDQMARAICREFNVDPFWLNTGEGNPFIDTAAETDNFIDVIMAGESEIAKATFKALAKMGGDTWEQFGKIVRAIAKELNKGES